MFPESVKWWLHKSMNILRSIELCSLYGLGVCMLCEFYFNEDIPMPAGHTIYDGKFWSLRRHGSSCHLIIVAVSFFCGKQAD